MKPRIMVDEDDYREAAAYASDYFTDKWGLLDAERFKTLVPVPWCSEHDERMLSRGLDPPWQCTRGFHAMRPCQLEPQQVYRIGQP